MVTFGFPNQTFTFNHNLGNILSLHAYFSISRYSSKLCACAKLLNVIKLAKQKTRIGVLSYSKWAIIITDFLNFKLIRKMLTPLSDQIRTFLNLRTYWQQKTPSMSISQSVLQNSHKSTSRSCREIKFCIKVEYYGE